MKILIVGAGAVGKVYGRTLALGGADVSFFVKEKYAASARKGFLFRSLKSRDRQKNLRIPPIFWKNYRVFTRLDEIKNETWDAVVLAMSSPALRSGWFPEFLKNVPGSLILTLQPGLKDKAYVLQYLDEDRFVDGTIHIVSFETPFLDEHLPTSITAYWAPPGSFAALSGTSIRVAALTDPLRAGGFSVMQVTDARKLNLIAAPVLALLVIGLKQSNWSFKEFSRSKWIDRVVAALPEAVAIQAKHFGAPKPPTFFLTKIFLRALLFFTKRVPPFDFEAFAKHHFLKVDDQMQSFLGDFIEIGTAHRFSVKHLEALRLHAQHPT